MLERILRMCPRLEHLGIGGCKGLGEPADGEPLSSSGESDVADRMLVALPSLCPSLTALNAHRLPGIVSLSALEQMLDGLPALVALDVHGTYFDIPLTSRAVGGFGEPLILSSPCGDGAEAFERWRNLGRRSPGEFFDGSGTVPFISPSGSVYGLEQHRANS